MQHRAENNETVGLLMMDSNKASLVVAHRKRDAHIHAQRIGACSALDQVWDHIDGWLIPLAI